MNRVFGYGGVALSFPARKGTAERVLIDGAYIRDCHIRSRTIQLWQGFFCGQDRIDYTEEMTMAQKRTILLVEDEGLVALSQKKNLEKYGYRVLTTSRGEKAVRLVETTPGIDLILMDINLGKGIDGTDAAQAILRDHDIPIVFLSSHTERDIVEKTEKITSYGYVVKDSGITVLDASIKMAFKLHEAHKSVEKSAYQFRAITDASIDIFWILDGEGRIVDANEASSAMTGYSRDELLTMSARDFEAKEDEEETKQHVQRIIDKGFDRFETRHRCKDGRVIDVEASVTFLRERNQFLVFFHDITERKRAGEELRKSKMLLESVINSTNDLVLVVDRDMRVVLSNWKSPPL